MKNGKVLLFALLTMLLSTSCSVEGRNNNSSSFNESISISTNYESSSTYTESSSSQMSNSTPVAIVPTMPEESIAFIDAVNAIEIDSNALEAIEYAFGLFEALGEDPYYWDHEEVLDAYTKLCDYEEMVNKLITDSKEIGIFMEIVSAIPNEITVDDEYLILRAEEYYSRLSIEAKTSPEVMQAYQKVETIRNEFNIMKNEVLAKKDAEKVAIFLDMVSNIPTKNLTYSEFYTIQDAIEYYELLSNNAKQMEGVPEAYQNLLDLKTQIDVKDGNGLFNINVIHDSNKWEAIVDITAKDPAHEVSGRNKVFELMVFENNVQIENAKMIKWGGSPYDSSYTKSDGTHSFSFTIGKGYQKDSIYKMTIIIKTNAKESYAVSFFYMVNINITYVGYIESELIEKRFETLSKSFIRNDYSDENWGRIQTLIQEGQTAINEAISVEHAKMIYSQYLMEFSKVEKIYTKLEGLAVIDVSSVIENKDNIVDESINSKWQSDENINEYVIIELPEEISLFGINIVWEVANAKEYIIKVSNVLDDWDNAQDVYHFTDGQSGNRTDEIRFDDIEVSGKYIKLELIEGSTSWGFNIYDFTALVLKNA